MTSLPQQVEDPGPLASVVAGIVAAYNRHDVPFFEKILDRDVLWLDEDGHFIGAKEQALYFIDEQLAGVPARKLAISNLRSGLVGAANDAGWAAFAYVVTGGRIERKGVTSILFRQTGVERNWLA